MLPERIAAGVLTGSDTVSIYTVPRQTRVAVSSVVLTNSSPDPAMVGVWIVVGTARYPVTPPELMLGSGDSYHITTPFALEPADSLSLKGASGVSYYVTAYREGHIPSPSVRAE